MKNFVQEGDTLTLTPNAAVASGVGFLFGTSLFGVATNDVAANTAGEFLTEGVVEIAKTSALAIAVGDRLYWDATNKVVNKTATAQQCVGIAVEAGGHQSVAALFTLGLRRLQLVAQCHQFINFGDDAVLFGKGWQRKRRISKIFR